ncbi:MAG: DUF1934 domain-containing protein [Clostridiales bacterium]|nr:DUF1934 domain-containing protein [Clostridiales bacterium]
MEHKLIPVIVTLQSYSRGEHGEKEQPVKLMCHGKMKLTTDGCMVRYQEVQQEDANSAPMVQDVMLNIQCGPVPRVTMTRMGDYGTTMVFVKDRRFEGAYHTPYGDLALALYAMQVQCKVAEDYGSIHLEYQLDMQGSYSAVQCIDVSFCAESSQPC